MKLKPLGDRLLVKPLEEEETTASGLVIPDTAKEKPQKGKVLAVGDGKLEDGKRIPLDVAEGEDPPELRTKAQPEIRTSELPLVAVHYLRIGDTTPEQYGPHDEHALGACVKPILVELRGLEAVVGAGR